MTKYIFILAALSLVLAGCGSSQTGSATNTSDTPVATIPTGGAIITTPGISPPATTASPLNLQIFTQYDTTKALEYQTFVEPNSATCISSATTPVVTCTLNIQEGRLYYSSLNFQLAWNTTACKVLTFQPYYYHASDLGAFLPPWSATTALNCSTASANTPPANCWGGAAPYMVKSFPKYTGLIFFTDESLPPGPQALAAPLTLVSAYSLSYGSNRLTTNDMLPAKMTSNWNYNGTNPQASMNVNGGQDSYLANTIVQYDIACQDDYADPLPFKIHLFINDVNSAPGNPVLNNFKSWIDLL